ncbi:MAG: gamma-glutamyl-gamma-aminobutyrate hydrolase family protein [Geminicoccaceae bacterium]|nr:gamma-glutamyl-gamma-aminobutyrate hydrolase family protein [Geminicoccaceae bacterium]MCX8101315.1 gamma-glutamyl-gamma-aminobutyrate hydrolase family protein [Geminicoccaceae bacterium]
MRPVIGVSACLKQGEHAPFHSVMDRYVEAVVTAAGALPVIVPAIGRAAELPALLDRLDGVLLTGSPSNVCPSHYDGPPPRPGNLADPRRDATTLPLIRLALAAQVPLFAICRGIQELNVALGGTLHQHLHEVPGRADHRSDKTRPYAERYEPRHPVTLVPGGRLQAILGVETRTVLVNSLHAQGIDRLAPGLVVEAVAEDGTIEAVSVAGAAFALGVQWHPEWRAADDPVSRRLFAAFGAAARARARARTRIR